MGHKKILMGHKKILMGHKKSDKVLLMNVYVT